MPPMEEIETKDSPGISNSSVVKREANQENAAYSEKSTAHEEDSGCTQDPRQLYHELKRKSNRGGGGGITPLSTLLVIIPATNLAAGLEAIILYLLNPTKTSSSKSV